MASPRQSVPPAATASQRSAPGSASTDATNPFSSDVIERWLEAHRRGTLTEAEPENETNVESRAPATPFSINQLAVDQLLCRLLIVEEQGALDVPGTERIHVRRKGTNEEADQSPVQCLAVPQRREDISCRIESPVCCELYYDSRDDTVQTCNRSHAPIRIEHISDADGEDGNERLEAELFLEPFDDKPTAPGAWRFTSFDGCYSFQIIVFPRRHSLALVRLKSLSALAGTKRDHPADEAENNRQAASEPDPVSSTEIIRRLDSLTEASEGQMINVMNAGTQEYSLFRMKSLGKTTSTQVFQAKHSSYPDRVVAVKTFMYSNKYNAVVRGKLWKSEYSVHRKLKSSVIVELFGADARIEALIMENVDASDLSSRRWCDIKGNKHFVGTRAHAERVFADMSRALLHLREKKVLHNDIKPANILFSEDRGAVLIDFGLATLDGSAPTTGGTPWYVAPEYLTRRRRGAPAEVWALGVVLAYLLGYMPLPDSERQVKSWLIKDVGRAPTRAGGLQAPADGAMSRWLGVLEAVMAKLGAEDYWLAKMVLRMLAREKDRITAEELNLALEPRSDDPAV